MDGTAGAGGEPPAAILRIVCSSSRHLAHWCPAEQRAHLRRITPAGAVSRELTVRLPALQDKEPTGCEQCDPAEERDASTVRAGVASAFVFDS